MKSRIQSSIVAVAALVAVAVVAAIAVFEVRQSEKRQAENRTELLALIRSAGLIPMKANTRSIDFQLKDPNGRTVRLADFRGKVVLINFWATWCPPCQAELPTLEALYKDYQSKDFTILAVDVAEDADVVKKYAADNGITYPIALDPTTHTSAVYGLSGIPVSFLVDQRGNVDSEAEGPRNWASVETKTLLDSLLQRL